VTKRDKSKKAKKHQEGKEDDEEGEKGDEEVMKREKGSNTKVKRQDAPPSSPFSS
jgi:hypothetical protein